MTSHIDRRLAEHKHEGVLFVPHRLSIKDDAKQQQQENKAGGKARMSVRHYAGGQQKQEQALATGLLPQALPADVDKQIEKTQISVKADAPLDSEVTLVHAGPRDRLVSSDVDRVPATVAPAVQKFRSDVLPQLQRVGEAYTKLTAGDSVGGVMDNVSAGIDDARATLLDQASSLRPVMHKAEVLYDEKIAPKLHQAKIRLEQMYEENVSEEHRQQVGEIERSFYQRLGLWRRKAMDVWEGNEPIVKEKAQMVADKIEKNGLTLPLIFLSTLLVLWLSISFVSWFAFPATSARNHIGAEPYHSPIDRHDHIHLPGGVRILPDLRPTQNVPAPTFADKLSTHLNGANDALAGKMDELRHKLPDLPSMDDLKDRIPSMEDIQSRMPNMPEMPTVDGIKQKLPAMDELKDKLADRVGHVTDAIKSAMPSSLHLGGQHKLNDDRVAGLRDAAGNLLQSEPNIVPADNEPFAPPHHHVLPEHHSASAGIVGEMKLKAQDRLHHVKDTLNPTEIKHDVADSVHDIKLKVEDRLHHMADKVKDFAGGVNDRVKDRIEHIKDALHIHRTDNKVAGGDFKPVETNMGTGPGKIQDRLHHLMP